MASVKYLIVDSSPLLTSPLASLRGMAENFLVTPDVVKEMRDSKNRNIVEEAKLHLVPSSPTTGVEGEPQRESGFIIREPSLDAIQRVTSFAHKTGDIGVLSSTDIRVLALCLTLEIEENGTWRVREFPGQVLTGPPKEEGAEEKKEDEVKDLAEKVEKNSLGEEDVVEEEREEPVASTSASHAAEEEPDTVEPEAEEAENESPPTEAQPEDSPVDEEEEEEEEEPSSEEEEEGTTPWITPSNLSTQKAKDLGLFTPPTSSSTPTKPKTIMKSAILTGDFAMQNVGLQMGLNVLGSGGKRVREVRTWVLRCHACFKLCKNPTKRFCPSCGGPTLLRTSITYVPATPENPRGYILHLKQNFQHRLRGTVYSLPSPKMGHAGGSAKSSGRKGEVTANPVLREDQKEWVRGVRTKEVREEKEVRALLRSVMDGGSRVDREWVPEMDKGEKGRKRGGKNGFGGEVRTDQSGLPVIGAGRKNVNEARRRR